MSYIPPNPNGQATKANSSPVVLASDQDALPLSSGAATSAKQPALGTAGTASTDVITVQGIASGTAQPVSGTVTANAGTNLNTSALAVESGGNLAAIKADVDKIPSQGQALAGASTPVVLPAAQITTLTPPTTVTSNQGTAAAVGSGWPMIGGELADTTGTFTNATQTTSVTTNNFDGYSTIIVSINGTYGTASAAFEISDDGGTTWYSVNAARSDGSAIETGYTALTNTNRMWTLSVSGADEFRVRSTAVASGTVNVRVSVESMPTPEAASVNSYQGTSPWVNNTSQINGVTPLMGNGVTGTGSQRVTIASDNTAFSTNAIQSGTWTVQPGNTANTTPWLIRQKSTTPTTTNVASSATNVTILASNANRIAAQIYNDSTQILYLKFGTTASSTSFTVPLAAATYFEVPGGYTGNIDGIWVSANGNARVTEIV